MNKQETGSGGGAAVAVVMILVVLAGFCVIVTLGGSLFYLGRSVQPVVIATPPMPTAVVTKTATAFRTAELAVAADSTLKLDGKPVELNELQVQLQQIRAASPNAMLDIQVIPAETAPYKAVSDVTDLLTATGFTYTIRSAEMAGAMAAGGATGGAPGPVVEEAADVEATESVEEKVETNKVVTEEKETADSEKIEEETP